MDKVHQRLSAWKSRTLYFEGRVTPAKFVLQPLPTYIMQTTWLPKSMCDDIDKTCRKFIWGDTENSKKFHLVSWGTVCTPKAKGELGLRKTRDVNNPLCIMLDGECVARILLSGPL
ncbi:hypothetical protein AAZX31_13G049300 [Glycine max]